MGDQRESSPRRITLDKVRAGHAPYGGRGQEGGISAASMELGIDRKDAQRSIKIAFDSSRDWLLPPR